MLAGIRTNVRVMYVDLIFLKLKNLLFRSRQIIPSPLDITVATITGERSPIMAIILAQLALLTVPVS